VGNVAGIERVVHAGHLVAWTNAVLGGTGSADELVPTASLADAFVGFPGHDTPIGPAALVGSLRSGGHLALRLVVPAQGDPLGLPGPSAVNQAAIDAGVAVLTVGPRDVEPLALIPAFPAVSTSAPVTWRVHVVDFATAPAGLPTLSEAQRGLTHDVRESTEILMSLDVARGRAAAEAVLSSAAGIVDSVELPDNFLDKARKVITDALRLRVIVASATQSDGGALTASEVERRLVALRPLDRAARHALAAAYSVHLEEVTR